MICKICGTPIPEDREYCDACLARHTSVTARAAELSEEEKAAYRRRTRVPGIVALVCSIVAMLTFSVGCVLTMLSYFSFDTEEAKATLSRETGDLLAALGAVFTVITAALCVVAVVFGIRAILSFRRAKSEGVKAVGGLVMGIIGLAEGSGGLLASFSGAFAVAVYYINVALL